jgi:hypothetical protein
MSALSVCRFLTGVLELACRTLTLRLALVFQRIARVMVTFGRNASLGLLAALLTAACKPPQLPLEVVLGKSPDEVASESPRPQAYSAIPLRTSAGLSAQLPDLDGRWIWTVDDRWTLVAHLSELGSVDVLFWSITPTAFPTLTPIELRMLVHELASPVPMRQWPVLPAFRHVAARHLLVSPDSASTAFSVAASVVDPTLGHGLGYTSLPDSFVGWRWTGVNRAGSRLLLAHSRGSWRRPVRTDAGVLSDLQRLPGVELSLPVQSGSGLENSAILVMGVVQHDAMPVPFGLLCQAEPACSQIDALKGFLDSLSLSASPDFQRSSTRMPPLLLNDFAARAQLIWQAGDVGAQVLTAVNDAVVPQEGSAVPSR